MKVKRHVLLDDWTIVRDEECQIFYCFPNTVKAIKPRNYERVVFNSVRAYNHPLTLWPWNWTFK